MSYLFVAPRRNWKYDAAQNEKNMTLKLSEQVNSQVKSVQAWLQEWQNVSALNAKKEEVFHPLMLYDLHDKYNVIHLVLR